MRIKKSKQKLKYKVFVPTKGRFDSSLIKLLRKEKIDCYMVIEPQDKEKYIESFPGNNFYVLPKNDGGLAYARQCILDFTREMKLEWYWQIDDNLTGFVEVKNGKCVPTTAYNALSNAEKIVKKHKRVGLLALEYQQFAWSATKVYQFNGRAYCCVLTATFTGLDYTTTLEAKADVDFMLNNFHNRWRTILVKKWAMCKPVMGTTKVGGQSKMYAADRNSIVAKQLQKKWPQYCKLFKKKSGLDVRVNWKRVNENFKVKRKKK